MAIGPIAHYHENSKPYSAIKPRPNKEVDANLPHVTIVMPVYKEGLDTVLCGTSNISINDDGMRLLNDEDRAMRLAFYETHGIGWVARPKHGDEAETGDGVKYKRAGRFKKALNVNYALHFSRKIEKHLLMLQDQQYHCQCASVSSSSSNPDEQPILIEDRALEAAVNEVYEESGRRWKPRRASPGSPIDLQ